MALKGAGMKTVKFDIDDLSNKATKKHIQRMITAFLTCDTLTEEALRKCNVYSLQRMLRSHLSVGENHYTKWVPDDNEPYMQISKVISSCNNQIADAGLRIEKVRRETDGSYYYCMYSQTTDSFPNGKKDSYSFDDDDTEEFSAYFRGVVLVFMIKNNGRLNEVEFGKLHRQLEETGNKKGGSKIINLLNDKFIEKVVEHNKAYFVLKPRMQVELSDSIRDVLKKNKLKPECFRCSELVLRCRHCPSCNARFHRYCVEKKCANPRCGKPFPEEIFV